jgi:hypothetical protein
VVGARGGGVGGRGGFEIVVNLCQLCQKQTETVVAPPPYFTEREGNHKNNSIIHKMAYLRKKRAHSVSSRPLPRRGVIVREIFFFFFACFCMWWARRNIRLIAMQNVVI